MQHISNNNFFPVMDYPDEIYLLDLSETYDPEFIASKEWAVGKYNERREAMYKAPQYEGKRDIHMGIDIWTSEGANVYAFTEGTVAYMEDHRQQGNYGPTIVTRHKLDETELYALYGHLSRESLEMVSIGQDVVKGQKIAEIGSEEVNGGWAPHLHFQLAIADPGEADMPGVVSEQDCEAALERYPDPRLVLGALY